MSLRLLVAAVGIPLLLGGAILGGLVLVAVIAVIQLLLLWEWRGFAVAANVQMAPILVAIAVASVDIFVVYPNSELTRATLLVAVYFWVLLVVFHKQRKPLLQLGYGALFILYAALPIVLWFPISELSDPTRHGKLGALGLLLGATWLCDSAAYFGGRTFGKHKLFLAASPNKTVEGAISGFVGAAVLLPILRALNFASPTPTDFLALPLTVGVAGQIGDLLESLIKREVGVKDSSHIVPGHGGVLDRFDSLLLASPLFLAYLFISSQ